MDTRRWRHILTREKLVFCVFGNEYPDGRAVSLLKYIPSRLKTLFSIRFFDRKWEFQGLEFVRPEKLYAAKNYQEILSFDGYCLARPVRSSMKAVAILINETQSNMKNDGLSVKMPIVLL